MIRQDEQAKEAAQMMSRFVNRSGDAQAFIDVMSRDHRTLQQGFTRLCKEWLEHLGTVEHFDMRNEASVALGKAFVELVPEDTRILPFI